MEQLKKRYNKLLNRYKSAEAWYCSNERVESDFTDKLEKEFLKILVSMSCILNEFTRMGIEYTDEEVLEGFKC